MTFSASKILHTYAIFDDNVQIGSIVVADIETSSQKNKIHFSEVKAIPVNPAENFEKLDLIYSDLVGLYDIQQDVKKNKIDDDYLKIFKKMEEQIRFFHFRLEYPYVIYILYSAFIVLIGLILIKCLFWNRFFTSK